jgi:hypothetical protein
LEIDLKARDPGGELTVVADLTTPDAPASLGVEAFAIVAAERPKKGRSLLPRSLYQEAIELLSGFDRVT